jgi:hypothetical protein
VSRRASLALAVTLAGTAFVGDARAADEGRGRPWGRRTSLVSPGFGLGLGNSATHLEFSLAGRYFVLDGLALGLTLSDEVSIYKEGFRSQYPGIEKQLPTNVFRLVPTLQYVFYRSRWFSPHVEVGLGPAFFNHGHGTFGHWVAGPGAYIGLGGPVYLDLGVDFFGTFPIDRCKRAYSASATTMGEPVEVSQGGMCSFGWRPKIGLVIALGRAPKRRPAKPPARPVPATIEPATRKPFAPDATPPRVAPEPAGDATPPPPGESPSEATPVGPDASPPGDAPVTPPAPPPKGVPDRDHG